MGWKTDVSNFCVNDTSKLDVLAFDFDVINYANQDWTFDTVTFYSGTDSTDEPEFQPWTYKKRGIWLDGNDVLTLKVDTNFILHAYMTFYTWIRP